MPEMFVMLIKFLLLSDVFNAQKAHFFHFYPTDLVNTKTNIPLRVGEQR